VALLFEAANEKTGGKILARKFQECWRTGIGQPPSFFANCKNLMGLAGSSCGFLPIRKQTKTPPLTERCCFGSDNSQTAVGF